MFPFLSPALFSLFSFQQSRNSHTSSLRTKTAANPGDFIRTSTLFRISPYADSAGLPFLSLGGFSVSACYFRFSFLFLETVLGPSSFLESRDFSLILNENNMYSPT